VKCLEFIRPAYTVAVMNFVNGSANPLISSPCLPQYMDYDYHSSFQRLVLAYKEAEREIGEAVMHSVDLMVENTKSLSFENDLHYFLQDYPQPFTPPNPFHFVPFDTDDVSMCLCEGVCVHVCAVCMCVCVSVCFVHVCVFMYVRV